MESKDNRTRQKTAMSKLSTQTVWICSYLPQSKGAGVERFVEMIAGIARKNGISPEIVNLASVVRENGSFRKFRYFVAWKIGREINRRAKEGDVIVCSNFFSWNARRARSMVVYHGTDRGRAIGNRKNMSFIKYLAVRTIGSYLEKRTGRGRIAVAVSNAAKEEVEKYYGIAVRKVVPNAVDLSLFIPSSDRLALRSQLGFPNDKFLALFVGTPDPRKGLGWILRDLKPRLGDDTHLVLRTDLTVAPDGVTVVKRLPIRQLALLYKASDVLLFPTSYEGCSFALVEALASGLPVITSPAGSGRDLREDAILRPYIIDGNDSEKYLECMNRLRTSREEWTRVSRAARSFAEKYHSLPDFEREYLGLIMELSQ